MAIASDIQTKVGPSYLPMHMHVLHIYVIWTQDVMYAYMHTYYVFTVS